MKKLFGLGHAMQMFGQPIRSHGISLSALWIHLGRQLEPGQNLLFLAVFEVRMLRHHEMPPESFDDVPGWPKKFLIFFMLFIRMLGYGVFPLLGGAVENRRVVTAVQINVSFSIKMVRKESTPVSQQYFENAVLSALAPFGRHRLQRCRKRKARGAKQRQ